MRILHITLLTASIALGWTYTNSGISNSESNTDFETHVEGGNEEHAGPVNWVSIQDALESNEKRKTQRYVLIDFYTDWCGWCKRMDATTFQDPELSKYINDNFHAVKFDAEQKEAVVYNGKTYEFQPGGSRGGTNGFAIEIAAKNGRLGYPTLAILDKESNRIESIPGFQDAKKLDARLKYYAEGYSEDFDFPTFLGMYDSPYTN
jgi:thioredoxin-related protein